MVEAATAQWSGSTDSDAPLVVLFHGWREDETNMAALVPALPAGLAYASLRAPVPIGSYYGWFARGHPFERTVHWFEDWLDGVTTKKRSAVLVGFSAGAAFAGGALLVSPARYRGAALLCGTLPFDAGLSTPPGRLINKNIFLGHSLDDPLMPHDVLDRAWDYLTQDSGAVADAKKYECGHEVSQEALADLASWLRAVTVR